MDIKDSNIFYDNNKKMYKVDLGFYTKFFDSLIFNKSLINKIYGENKNIGNNLKTNSNYIFGFTSFFEYNIVSIFNIDTFNINDKIVFDYKLTNFNINGNDYFLLIYLDLDNNVGFLSDFSSKDFILNIENNNFFIKNNIFETIIFEFSFKFYKFTKNNINKKKLEYSMIDVYYFRDLYGKNNENFINDLLKINIDYFEINYDFQVVKFEIYNTENKFLNELHKLFLAINNIQLLSYLPENKAIKDLFLDFKNISKFDIKELNFDFVKPKNVFEYDEKFLFFTRNFYLLEYILYVMKINYKNILENNSTIKQNEYEKLAFLRQNITRENLQKNILYFEGKFDIIKRKIIN